MDLSILNFDIEINRFRFLENNLNTQSKPKPLQSTVICKYQKPRDKFVSFCQRKKTQYSFWKLNRNYFFALLEIRTTFEMDAKKMKLSDQSCAGDDVSIPIRTVLVWPIKADVRFYTHPFTFHFIKIHLSIFQ